MSWLWWVVWFPLVIGSFGVIEAYAFRHPDRQFTLSRTMATLGAKFPLSIALLGMLFGGLLVHFYWHWGCDISNALGFMQ
jgi:hypothetical protein